MTITTVLLDLDNTLLGNDMNDFLPPYFAGLKKRLHKFINGKDLQHIMIASIQVMRANQNPNVTNMTAFMTDFAQRLDVPIEVIQTTIDNFYRQDYPQLEQHTTFYPEARDVVSYLLAEGYKVVIATNPLFPATALEQRIAWAGIGDLPYTLVTTMENSHFSKPNLLYYQEILTKIKSTPKETWMVGDDFQNDIAPARELGLKTWWITEKSTPSYNKQGRLVDFLAWIKQGGLL